MMSAVCVMKEIKPDKIADPAGTGKKVRLREYNIVLSAYGNIAQTQQHINIAKRNMFSLLSRFWTTGVQARNYWVI